MPELKSFLKDYEAEEYEGVTVEYIHGRQAILTIYHDDVEVEKITLSDYETKDDMHKLMIEKGFIKKSDDEIITMKKLKKEEEKRIQDEKDKKRKERIEKNKADKEKRRLKEEAAKAAAAAEAEKAIGEEKAKSKIDGDEL